MSGKPRKASPVVKQIANDPLMLAALIGVIGEEKVPRRADARRSLVRERPESMRRDLELVGVRFV